MTKDKQMGGIVGILTINSIDKKTGEVVDSFSDRNVVTLSGMGWMWKRLSQKDGSSPFRFHHFTLGDDTGESEGGDWNEFFPKPADASYDKSFQDIVHEDSPDNLVDSYPTDNKLQLSSLLDGQAILDNEFPNETEVPYNSVTLRFANNEVFSYKRFPVRTITRLLDIQIIWEFSLVDSALFDCGILFPESEINPNDHNFGIDIYAGYWGDSTIRKLNDQGQEVWVYSGHSNWVMDLAVGEDYVFSASRDTEVHVIDKSSGSNVSTIVAHDQPINSILLDGDYIVTASDDSTVKQWNMDGELQWTYEGNEKAMKVTNSPIGYVAAFRTGSIVLLSKEGNVESSFDVGGEVVFVHVDVDTNIILSTKTNTGFFVRKFNSSDFTEEWNIPFDHYVFGIRSDNNANIFTSDDDGRIMMFDRAGSPLWINDRHIGMVRGLDRDKFGYLYSASNDQTVRKFTPQGDHVWTFTGNENAASCVAADKYD